jgi:hypothetical protein
MAELACALWFLVGMSAGAAYAAWLLGGWPMMKRLAALIRGDSDNG